MQLSPQALPAEHTLQHAAYPGDANDGEAHPKDAGPIANEAADNKTLKIFMIAPAERYHFGSSRRL
jgi:hypothetical protein